MSTKETGQHRLDEKDQLTENGLQASKPPASAYQLQRLQVQATIPGSRVTEKHDKETITPTHIINVEQWLCRHLHVLQWRQRVIWMLSGYHGIRKALSLENHPGTSAKGPDVLLGALPLRPTFPTGPGEHPSLKDKDTLTLF